MAARYACFLLLAAVEVPAAAVLLRAPTPPTAAEQINQVKEAVRQASYEGERRIEEMVAHAAAPWAGSIHNVIAQETQRVRQVGDEQILATRTGVQAEKERESTVAQAMSKAVMHARADIEEEVKQTAVEWGRSRVQGQVARITNRALDRAWKDHQVVHDLKPAVMVSTETGLRVASKVVEVAKEMDRLASALVRARDSGLPRSVQEEDRRLQAQAAQTNRLAELAGEVMYQANAFAKRTLASSVLAEATAAETLRVARRSSDAISQLKSRAQAALQTMKELRATR